MKRQDALAPRVQDRDNLAFLPAALEVLETPPAPFGRILAITIAAFFSLAILWAWFGTVDVVAIAHGQTIPSGKVKIVQPLETGVVRAIHVQDGQAVEKGDVLIELDPTESRSNIDSLYADLAQAKLDAASGAAYLASSPREAFVAPAGVRPDLIEVTRDILGDELARHKAALLALRSEISRSRAAIRSAEIERAKLKRTIPLTEARLEMQEELRTKGLAQMPIVLALQQELYEQEAALANTTEERAQNLASIDSLKARRSELEAEFRTQASEKRRDGLRQIAILEQSLKKEEQRLRYRGLRAPVSGVVHQLSVHTIGAVVNSAEQLLIIIPKDTPLEIEAMILNKDIGFVEADQAAAIKLEAFPFTRYGTVAGKIESISDDAIIHEELGPVYKVRASLDSQQIQIEGKLIELSPGMNVSVEVKTGTRRIIEFFLSPLLRYQDEAIRER